MGNSKKKQDRAKLNKLCCNKVSITFFLSAIAGLHHPAIYRKELTHKEVKSLFPALKRTSFDYVLDDPESVYTGEIIMVEDALGNVVPYINPDIEEEEMEDVFFDDDYLELDPVEEIPNIDEIDLEELTVYELTQLLRTYNDAGIRGAYRRVHNELMSRNDSKCASTRSKQRVHRKENKNLRFYY